MREIIAVIFLFFIGMWIAVAFFMTVVLAGGFGVLYRLIKGRWMKKKSLILLSIVTLLLSIGMVSIWVNWILYTGFPWDKERFHEEAIKYLEQTYPAVSFHLDEPEFACPGFFRANCSRHWRAKGTVSTYSEVTFYVAKKNRDNFEDNLGIQLWEEQFRKDLGLVEEIIWSSLREEQKNLVIGVFLYDQYFSTYGFGEISFIPDYIEMLHQHPKELKLSVKIDWIHKMDNSGKKGVVSTLWRLKKDLEKSGFPNFDLRVRFYDPIIFNEITDASQMDQISVPLRMFITHELSIKDMIDYQDEIEIDQEIKQWK